MLWWHDEVGRGTALLFPISTIRPAYGATIPLLEFGPAGLASHRAGLASSIIWIQRCSVCPEMSNKIALVSLDFAGAGSMCGGNKGVGPWMRN